VNAAASSSKLAKGANVPEAAAASAAAPAAPPGPSASVLLLTRAIAPRFVFDVRAEDGELATSVRRWAQVSGYALRWDVGTRVPVLAASRIDATDFPAALTQVTQALTLAGYSVGHAMVGPRDVRVFERDRAGVFEIKPDDAVIAASLQRWGRSEGYDVLWESPIQVPLAVAGATAQRVVANDFRGALAKTIKSLQELGYPIQAWVHSDRVVRIVNKEQ